MPLAHGGGIDRWDRGRGPVRLQNYGWRFHAKQEWIENAAIGRPCQGKAVQRGNAVAQGNCGYVVLFCGSIGRIRGSGAAAIVGSRHIRVRLGKANGVPLPLAVERMLHANGVNSRLQNVGIDSATCGSAASGKREIVDSRRQLFVPSLYG